MARRQAGPRVYGPFPHYERWRIMVRDGGITHYYSYPTEIEAGEVAAALRRRVAAESGRSISQAIDAYELHLRDKKRNKPKSYTETVRRLRQFFAPVDAELLADLTPRRAAALYEAMASRISPITKRLLSVDTHRNALAEAKTFMTWCVGQRWIKASSLAEVKGEGKRRHGKPQLRIDEARRWIARALELSRAGEEGATAALAALLLGVRAGELVDRQVRDLDDGGRLLWIPDAKTPAGRRQLEVPEVLRACLLRQLEAKLAEAPLFATRTKRGGLRRHAVGWVRGWVQEICRQVGVPEVCAHAMRGLHSTLAMEAGATGRVVAAALGHEHESTTLESYADREVVGQAARRKAWKVLEGGK